MSHVSPIERDTVGLDTRGRRAGAGGGGLACRRPWRGRLLLLLGSVPLVETKQWAGAWARGGDLQVALARTR